MTQEQFKTVITAVFSSALDVVAAVALEGGVEYDDVVEVTQGIFKALYEGGEKADEFIKEHFKN